MERNFSQRKKLKITEINQLKGVVIPFLINRSRRMKKYIWFFTGYVSALVTILVVSCSYTPLEAGSSDCGESSYNPCYVKIVD